MSDKIIFTRHKDGSVTADKFPDEIEITPELRSVIMWKATTVSSHDE